MGYFILFTISLLLLSQAFIGLPGSVLAAVVVPGNMVEGTLQTGINTGKSPPVLV